MKGILQKVFFFFHSDFFLGEKMILNPERQVSERGKYS
jgi:hypothetical protein